MQCAKGASGCAHLLYQGRTLPRSVRQQQARAEHVAIQSAIPLAARASCRRLVSTKWLKDMNAALVVCEAHLIAVAPLAEQRHRLVVCLGMWGEG